MTLYKKWTENKTKETLVKILDEIDWDLLFAEHITGSYYKYVEIWISEDDEIFFLLRPQNEYSQDETGLVACIQTTQGHNEFLWQGWLDWDEDDEIFVDPHTGDQYTEEEAQENAIKYGDWSFCFDQWRSEILETFRPWQ